MPAKMKAELCGGCNITKLEDTKTETDEPSLFSYGRSDKIYELGFAQRFAVVVGLQGANLGKCLRICEVLHSKLEETKTETDEPSLFSYGRNVHTRCNLRQRAEDTETYSKSSENACVYKEF